MFPGPLIRLSDAYSLYVPPVNLRNSSHDAGGPPSCGAYGPSAPSANRSGTLSDGYFVMFASACRTVVVGVPPTGVVFSNSVSQLASSATQLATMFASESNVSSVDVSPPFGELASTSPTAPLAGSAMFAAIRTALCIPYALPPIDAPSTNCANDDAIATVVSSSTTTPSCGNRRRTRSRASSRPSRRARRGSAAAHPAGPGSA